MYLTLTVWSKILRKAVNEDAIPFAVSVKQRFGFGVGLSSEDVTSAFTAAVQRETAKNQRNGFLVVKYGQNAKQAYLKNAGGRTEYVNSL